MAEENKKTLEEKCLWKSIIGRDVKQGQKYGVKGKKCIKCPGYDPKCYIYHSIYQSSVQLVNNLLN